MNLKNNIVFKSKNIKNYIINLRKTIINGRKNIKRKNNTKFWIINDKRDKA